MVLYICIVKTEGNLRQRSGTIARARESKNSSTLENMEVENHGTMATRAVQKAGGVVTMTSDGYSAANGGRFLTETNKH